MRRYIRHPTDVPIEVSKNDFFSREHLRNVSRGGVAFYLHEALPIGSDVLIRIAVVEPVFEVPARIVWCRKKDDYYDVGAELICDDDVFRLRMVEQICHIEHYKREVKQLEGRVLTGEQAAREWISRYAASFPTFAPRRQHNN
ncbi:MAG: PilZ domain-containing protein [Gammaproteobacteria bacterium]|nr:PilZ domain-containing protein [Gammaproteobacteria bacterium]